MELSKFKLGFDLTFLVLTLVLTWILFQRIVAVGVGTVIMACCNGPLIGTMSRWFDRHFEVGNGEKGDKTAELRGKMSCL